MFGVRKVKFHWLILSFLSLFLFASPAQAGKILFWRFDSSQNRLTFTTDGGVQPKAQLISDPTRLIIDLPGTTLGRPTVNQSVGGTITSVRVGQFDAQTTRLVIELAPGYTIDPQKIKIQGSSPRQWSVDLPTPERINLLPNTLPPNRSSSDSDFSNLPSSSNNNTPSEINSRYFQVTDNGLFVKIGQQEPDRITVRRSQDGEQIDFFLDGIVLDRSLYNQSFTVNRYGVNSVEFYQSTTPDPWARITLKVERNSPNWQAKYSSYGGLVLLPEGGMGAVNNNQNSPSPNVNRPSSRSQENLVQSIELSNDGSQLLIQGEGKFRAKSNWNRDTGIYEIRIKDTKIAENFIGPQLKDNDPISVMRILEDDDDNVLILIQPALGVKIDKLNQREDRLLALEFNQSQASVPKLIDIPVPPPQNPSNSTNPLPPVSTSTNTTGNNNYNGRILIMVDAGHGGKDPGTIGINGIQEKNIILPISQHLEQFLTSQGLKVIMTRSSDYFVSLEGRTQMANRAGADLFVSIHANAINLSRPDVNGLETYYYQSGGGLANAIHRSVLQRMNIRDRGVRTARFYVLRNSSMPSVLVEVGFLTGREDHANLTNPDYRRRMAEAIGFGILEYIKQNKI